MGRPISWGVEPDLETMNPTQPKLQSLPELVEVQNEVLEARASWPPMNSAHEAYAILLEEVHELWEHVKTNQKKRDLVAMKKEAIQVAAMAIRFASEVCDEKTGRK